jgi:acetoacetate decarboxylase
MIIHVACTLSSHWAERPSTTGYKHLPLDIDDARAEIAAPSFMLKVLRSCNSSTTRWPRWPPCENRRAWTVEMRRHRMWRMDFTGPGGAADTTA